PREPSPGPVWEDPRPSPPSARPAPPGSPAPPTLPAPPASPAPGARPVHARTRWAASSRVTGSRATPSTAGDAGAVGAGGVSSSTSSRPESVDSAAAAPASLTPLPSVSPAGSEGVNSRPGRGSPDINGPPIPSPT